MCPNLASKPVDRADAEADFSRHLADANALGRPGRAHSILWGSVPGRPTFVRSGTAVYRGRGGVDVLLVEIQIDPNALEVFGPK